MRNLETHSRHGRITTLASLAALGGMICILLLRLSHPQSDVAGTSSPATTNQLLAVRATRLPIGSLTDNAKKSTEDEQRNLKSPPYTFANETNAEVLLQVVSNRTASIADRAAAADAIGKLRAKGAVDPLLQILGDDSESVMLKYKAARALGLLNDDRAVPVLTSLLDSQTTDRHLRVVSALALGNLGTKDAVQALGRAEQDADRLVRFKAVQALEGTRDAASQEIVTKALDDPDIFVQARAIQSLGKIGGGSSLTTISQILQSTDSDFIRIACLTALGDVNAPDAVAILHRYENDTNQLLSQNAKSALQRLNPKERNSP